MQTIATDAEQVKRRVTDVWAVLHALGLADGARRQARGAMIRCLRHSERTGSCSITIGPEGTLRLHCFSCGWTGDLFALVAAACGLDERRDFPVILNAIETRLGLNGSDALPVPSRRRHPPMPARPPLHSVAGLWARCIPVCENPTISEALYRRAIDPAIVTDRDLARCLPPLGSLPVWARHAGRDWRDSGHLLLVPLVNALGDLASVHARSLSTDASPKGLSPTGYSSAGLVLADSFARQLLAHGKPKAWPPGLPPTILICEGLPDFLTNATHFGEWEYAPCVLGVLSGAWSKEIAARVPDGARVLIRTHSDSAGQGYRRQIAESLCGRCHVEVLRHG